MTAKTKHNGKEITKKTVCGAKWSEDFTCEEVAQKLCATWKSWATTPPPLPCAHDGKTDCLKKSLKTLSLWG